MDLILSLKTIGQEIAIKEKDLQKEATKKEEETNQWDHLK